MPSESMNGHIVGLDRGRKSVHGTDLQHTPPHERVHPRGTFYLCTQGFDRSGVPPTLRI